MKRYEDSPLGKTRKEQKKMMKKLVKNVLREDRKKNLMKFRKRKKGGSASVSEMLELDMFKAEINSKNHKHVSPRVYNVEKKAGTVFKPKNDDTSPTAPVPPKKHLSKLER